MDMLRGDSMNLEITKFSDISTISRVEHVTIYRNEHVEI